MKWRPPLIESLSVNPVFNLNFVDLLLAPGEINEKLSLPINPFKHCMMQQIKSFRVNEIRDWYHHCLKNISYQQIILIAKLIKCKVPIKVILADILSIGRENFRSFIDRMPTCGRRMVDRELLAKTERA